MPLRTPNSTRYHFRNRSVRAGRPRRPLLVLAGIVVPMALVGGAAAAMAATTNHRPWPHPKPSPTPTEAAAPNPNCSLIVPANPLSAQGLATPYQLVATDRKAGRCNESNDAQSAFVEATIIDPATGAVSVYHPLVIDRGTQPAAPPPAVTLPAGAVVGIWFGSDGDTLQLRDTNGSLAAGKCVNGLGDSLFGQFAYCNAPAFFAAANAAISAKKLTVPAAATAKDGLPCPTTRDFAIVDQDQSDNLITSYLLAPNGRIAPNTTANRTKFGAKATLIKNGSDIGLVAKFVDPALGCTPWAAPNLDDPGTTSSSMALSELAAAAQQKAPVALVPTSDPMAQVDGATSVAKTNLYRAGVDQPALAAGANTGRSYCINLVRIQPMRLIKDWQFFQAAPSPDTAAAANLLGLLAQRLQAAFGLLGCDKLLHVKNPVNNLQINGNQITGAGVNPNMNPESPDPDATTPAPKPSVSAERY